MAERSGGRRQHGTSLALVYGHMSADRRGRGAEANPWCRVADRQETWHAYAGGCGFGLAPAERGRGRTAAHARETLEKNSVGEGLGRGSVSSTIHLR